MPKITTRLCSVFFSDKQIQELDFSSALFDFHILQKPLSYPKKHSVIQKAFMYPHTMILLTFSAPAVYQWPHQGMRFVHISNLPNTLYRLRHLGQNNTSLDQGPFKYYVIKILTPFDPTHPVCNQTSLIKQTNSMLLRNHLAYPTHTPILIT